MIVKANLLQKLLFFCCFLCVCVCVGGGGERRSYLSL